MAAADYTLAKGTRVKLSTDGSSYTLMTDVVKIGQPGARTAPDVDVTPIDPDTNDREYGTGMGNQGDFPFSQLWNAARESYLQGLIDTTVYVRIIYPDATLEANRSRRDFKMRVKEVNVEEISDPDTRLVLSVKGKISGKVTFTPKT